MTVLDQTISGSMAIWREVFVATYTQLLKNGKEFKVSLDIARVAADLAADYFSNNFGKEELNPATQPVNINTQHGDTRRCTTEMAERQRTATR